jgi:heme oxygenase (mycobilin-producing)
VREHAQENEGRNFDFKFFCGVVYYTRRYEHKVKEFPVLGLSRRRKHVGDRNSDTKLSGANARERRKGMAVKIIIKRRVPKDKEANLLPLLIQLRALATAQSGYISGETLRSMQNLEEYLVISTWQSSEDWEKWLSSPQRAEIQEKVDMLLGQKTMYDTYLYG